LLQRTPKDALGSRLLPAARCALWANAADFVNELLDGKLLPMIVTNRSI
jgi:hypothetical protein